MKLVVISPEGDDARERDLVLALFAAGLERYHLRKPAWSRERMETWLRALPVEARARVMLHQHHALVAKLALGGVHQVGRGIRFAPDNRSKVPSAASGVAALPPGLTSRSCHTLTELRASLGHYDSVFFGPVFPSISKPGYGPHEDSPRAEISALLAHRTASERRTTVVALGGITAETAPRALALGFDGVAALGAIWQAADPLHAFTDLQNSLVCHAA